MSRQLIQHLNFWLSEHPSIVHFRWSPTESWGATWSFLITSIAAYITISASLHILLRRLKPVPLGPVPALHSLAMSLLSAAIFAGMVASSVAEIRDTRWFWRRNKTPFQWLLCFPLGTRPSGRVFFWSYAFYLSRFLHILRTFFSLLRRPGSFPLFQVINHAALICMSFLWLEFSQSFQVLAILSMSVVFALVYAFRFCTEVGLKQTSHFPFVMLCQIALVVTNTAWHLGVLVLHFWKGGCNGMGAWIFNTVLNSFVLLLLLNFYVRKCLSERDAGHYQSF
ncbi:elongation of fatty acids protein 3-like [Salvia divinorum]|uniref:Elongation of fatty acids protein 3-like n=1 Tax=Salvia divinorum TaxID=28513 RepID=A0ABD1G8S3_SALDI